VALRALLLEGAHYRDLTLMDAVSGGNWETGLYRLILKHSDVFNQLPDYAHEALVASHLRHATHVGYRPEVLDAFLAPWRGARQDTRFLPSVQPDRPDGHGGVRASAERDVVADAPHLGSEDRILPPPLAQWLHDRLPHAELLWVEGADHLLQEDAPAQLLAHLTTAFPAGR